MARRPPSPSIAFGAYDGGCSVAILAHAILAKVLRPGGRGWSRQGAIMVGGTGEGVPPSLCNTSPAAAEPEPAQAAAGLSSLLGQATYVAGELRGQATYVAGELRPGAAEDAPPAAGRREGRAAPGADAVTSQVKAEEAAVAREATPGTSGDAAAAPAAPLAKVKEAQDLLRSVLVDHTTHDTMSLHLQSLGSAVDAGALSAAWAGCLHPGGPPTPRGARAAARSPEPPRGGLAEREQAFGRLAAALDTHGFRDALLLSALTLLDRVFCVLGPSRVPTANSKQMANWLLAASLVALKIDNAEAETECDIQELVMDKLGAHIIACKSRERFQKLRTQLWQEVIKTERQLLHGLSWMVGSCGPADLAVRLAIGAAFADPAAPATVRQQDMVVATVSFLVELSLTHAHEVAYGRRLPPSILALASAGLAVHTVLAAGAAAPGAAGGAGASPAAAKEAAATKEVAAGASVAAALAFLQEERDKLVAPQHQAALEKMTATLLRLWRRPPPGSHVARRWLRQPGRAARLPEPPPAGLAPALAEAWGVEPPPDVPPTQEPASPADTPPPAFRGKGGRATTPEPKTPAPTKEGLGRGPGGGGGAAREALQAIYNLRGRALLAFGSTRPVTRRMAAALKAAEEAAPAVAEAPGAGAGAGGAAAAGVKRPSGEPFPNPTRQKAATGEDATHSTGRVCASSYGVLLREYIKQHQGRAFFKIWFSERRPPLNRVRAALRPSWADRA